MRDGTSRQATLQVLRNLVAALRSEGIEAIRTDDLERSVKAGEQPHRK